MLLTFVKDRTWEQGYIYPNLTSRFHIESHNRSGIRYCSAYTDAISFKIKVWKIRETENRRWCLKFLFFNITSTIKSYMT